MSPRVQWLLKVVAGPHQGAEIELPTGKTLIGSDDECDVVLHDVLIAPQHLELDLGVDGIMAAPLGGRIFIGGKRVRDARQQVPSFTFLSLGGTHLVIGPAKGAWPLLSAADAPELEREVEVPSTSSEEDDVDNQAEVQGNEKPSESAEQAPAPVSPPVAKLRPWFGIAAGILLLLGWVIIYQRMQMRNEGMELIASETKESDLAPSDRAQAIVDRLGLTGDIVIEDSGGRLSASGYVETDAKQRELQASFREELPGLRSKIYSREKITSSARSLIDSQRLPLEVACLAEGKLKVSGKLSSNEGWIPMRATLLREIPGVSEVQDEVEIVEDKPVMPQPVAPVVAVAVETASATPIQSAVPSPTAEPVAEADPFDVFVTADSVDRADSVIATIRADRPETAFMKLSTGGVYFVGGRLPFGGTITQIEADRITVQEGGATRSHTLGQTVTRSRSTASTNTP